MRVFKRINWLFTMLVCVALVLAGSGAPFVAAQQVEEHEAEPLVDTVEVLPGASGSYGSISTRVDAAGNTFMAYVDANPRNSNQTWATVRKYLPSGVTERIWYVFPKNPEMYKIDHATITYSGSTLLVHLTSHTYGTPLRVKRTEVKALVGVFSYRQGMEFEEGAAGAWVPGAQQSCPPIDYGQIRLAVQEEVRSVLRQEKVVTENMYAYERGSHIIYNQSLNIVHRALTNYGAATAVPSPAPTPRP